MRYRRPIPPGLERESDVRERVVKKLRALGCEVLCYSSHRRAPGTPGAPDTLIVPPRRLAPFLWEAKAADGRPSEKQLAIQRRIEANGTRVIIGGEAEVEAHLKQIGLAA